MKAVLLALLASFRSRTALQLEVLALRHQLPVYQRCPTRPRTEVADRLLGAWLSRIWAGGRDALVLVQPATVIAWQRRRYCDPWARFSQARPGRHWLAGQGGCGIQTAPALAHSAAALVLGEPVPPEVLAEGVAAEALAPGRLAR